MKKDEEENEDERELDMDDDHHTKDSLDNIEMTEEH